MTTLSRFLLAALGGAILLTAAITATVAAEGLTVVLPDGRTIAAARVDYDTGTGRIVVTERAFFMGSFE